MFSNWNIKNVPIYFLMFSYKIVIFLNGILSKGILKSNLPCLDPMEWQHMNNACGSHAHLFTFSPNEVHGCNSMYRHAKFPLGALVRLTNFAYIISIQKFVILITTLNKTKLQLCNV
jgi:hypothetical protein